MTHLAKGFEFPEFFIWIVKTLAQKKVYDILNGIEIRSGKDQRTVRAPTLVLGISLFAPAERKGARGTRRSDHRR